MPWLFLLAVMIVDNVKWDRTFVIIDTLFWNEIGTLIIRSLFSSLLTDCIVLLWQNKSSDQTRQWSYYSIIAWTLKMRVSVYDYPCIWTSYTYMFVSVNYGSYRLVRKVLSIAVLLCSNLPRTCQRQQHVFPQCRTAGIRAVSFGVRVAKLRRWKSCYRLWAPVNNSS